MFDKGTMLVHPTYGVCEVVHVGKIDMKNDRIMIQSVYEVSGNVDLATGNICWRIGITATCNS